MKFKFLNLIVVSILLATGFSSCSNHDFDPNDYVVSILSGKYGKGGFELIVTENSVPIEYSGYVVFHAKDLNVKMEADFNFVDILPGESKREFKNVKLYDSEEGILFTIDYEKDKNHIEITGTLFYGSMTININTNPES
ncbi:MAG: hypothetical protein J1E16_06300 [Muribaculaceae bacterium]|nr:hypothetical protein [Muribaculaceae bacterium]